MISFLNTIDKNLINILYLSLSYLIGGIPTGYLLCKKYRSINILEYGSHSMGATNVLRVSKSKWLAVATLLGDFAKGGIVALLFGITNYYCLFAALFGHIYSIYLGFRGGKGVSSAAGIFLIISPINALCSFCVWALVLKIFKISAIASLSMSFSFFLFCLLTSDGNIIRFSLFVFLFLCFTHRRNIAEYCKVLNGSNQ